MDHLHRHSPALALQLSALMTSVRCGKTDNFPPRARPLRVATFYSSGRTWIGFLLRTHGTSIRPTFACQSPPPFYLIFIFFSGPQGHCASCENLGWGEHGEKGHDTDS